MFAGEGAVNRGHPRREEEGWTHRENQKDGRIDIRTTSGEGEKKIAVTTGKNGDDPEDAINVIPERNS